MKSRLVAYCVICSVYQYFPYEEEDAMFEVIERHRRLPGHDVTSSVMTPNGRVVDMGPVRWTLEGDMDRAYQAGISDDDEGVL